MSHSTTFSRMTRAQQDQVIAWVQEGKSELEIKSLAYESTPRFIVSHRKYLRYRLLYTRTIQPIPELLAPQERKPDTEPEPARQPVPVPAKPTKPEPKPFTVRWEDLLDDDYANGYSRLRAANAFRSW